MQDTLYAETLFVLETLFNVEERSTAGLCVLPLSEWLAELAITAGRQLMSTKRSLIETIHK